jgi:hypothetical protein
MSAIKLFQNQEIRSQWDADREQRLFSVIDIIQVLTGSERPRKYWSDLKKKLNQEGSQLSEKIEQLKMRSADGKSYLLEESLNHLEQEFAARFVRIHRNCLVAREAIAAFEKDADGGWAVRLHGVEETLPVSRRQQHVVKELGR